MKRGEIYDARLEPVEGSEQGGTRPVIVVSRTRLIQLRGTLNQEIIRQLNQALIIALDLL